MKGSWMFVVPSLCAVVPLGAQVPVVPVQDAYLKASNTGAAALFGWSVAMSGDTLLVGAPQAHFSTGRGYVFVLEGGAWSQHDLVGASNAGANDRFGHAVAIDGDTLVVGAPDEDSPATGVGGTQGNGAPSAGAAYVFVRSGTIWNQQAYLKPSNTDEGDEFGISVAISGDTIVVGAHKEASAATGVDGDEDDDTAPSAGAAYVFVRNGTTWSQQAYVKPSNTEAQDLFGHAVGVSGDTVAVSARWEDSDATGVDGDQGDNDASRSGAVYVFTRSGTTWSQQAYLKPSNTDASDEFGYALAIDGDLLLVGAWGEDSPTRGVSNGGEHLDNATNAGAAYAFRRSGSVWSQEAYLKASNTEDVDVFGDAVAVQGDTLVVGARGEDSGTPGPDSNQSDDAAPSAGAAFVFVHEGGAWEQSAYLKASNPDAEDRFARAVAVAQGRVLVGAYQERSNATGIDGDEEDDSLASAGAAYVFELDAPQIGARFCSPAVPNSTGDPGLMAVLGSTTVTDDDLLLVAQDLAVGSNIGYFLMGTGTNTFTPPGSAGPICIAPGLLRFLPPVHNANLSRGFRRDVGTSGPISSAITPGSTWSFQAWHRDSTAGISNLTDAVSVTFD